MPKYFVLGRAPKPGRWIAHSPYIKGVQFTVGQLITAPVPVPLEYTLKKINPQSDDHSAHMPAFLKGNQPLFRDDLIAAMRECGVNNLQCFQAVLQDPEGDRQHTNYQVVNIVGLIAAADLSKSTYTVPPSGGPPVIDTEFDHLVIDEAKPRNQLLFRLAESTMAIMVHENLRGFLVARGFDDLVFHEPGEVAL